MGEDAEAIDFNDPEIKAKVTELHEAERAFLEMFEAKFDKYNPRELSGIIIPLRFDK